MFEVIIYLRGGILPKVKYLKPLVCTVLILLVLSLTSLFISEEISTPDKITSFEIVETTNQDNNLEITQKSSEKQTPQKIELSIDKPQEKVEEELIKKAAEKPEEKVRIFITVEDDEDIEEIKKKIKGDIKESYETGNIVVAELSAEEIEDLAEDDSVITVSSEKEYSILLDKAISESNIDSVWDTDLTGKGIKIAVLDTGIDDSHDMFKDKNIISENFINNKEATDFNGHGTHVAGIAAGNADLKGVAKDADILNAKVLDSQGKGSTSSIIAGINWAVEEGADIITISFGSSNSDFDSPLVSAIDEAIENGVIVIAASGNCRKGCGSFYGVTFPGSLPEVITVGAVDDKELADFSSGDKFKDYIKPDFTAPGVDIRSSFLNNEYKDMSGTSMSAPFVAGIAALLLEKEKDISQQQVLNLFAENSIDLGEEGKDTEYGWGIVDVEELFLDVVVEDIIENETTNETISEDDIDARVYDEIINQTGNTYYFQSEDGDVLKVRHFKSKLYNSDNGEFNEQMVVSPYVLQGQDTDIILEFEGSDLEPSHPDPYRVRVYIDDEDNNDPAIDIFSFTIPDDARNDLIAGEYASFTVTIGVPDELGNYKARAYLADSGGTVLYPYVSDPSPRLFEVVDEITGDITCYEDSDCGVDTPIGNPYCENDDEVYQEYKKWICMDPGEITSRCDWYSDDRIEEECGHNEVCNDGECIDRCNEGFTGNKRCNSNTVEEEYQYENCDIEWRQKEVCSDEEKCESGVCVDKTCSDYGLSESCSNEGTYKKENNKVFECKDQVWIGQTLCWEPISNLGDDNFCNNLDCDHNEYDCDFDSQCSDSLSCKGEGICLGNECGCCYSFEEWDTNSNTCKKPDGYSCDDGSECIGNYCLVGSSTCWNSPYKIGDNYCDDGETCSNSPDDCGRCDGESCSTGSECENNYCVHAECWNSPYKTEDGYCDTNEGENKDNSEQDCYEQLVVLEIIEYPDEVEQGESFEVRARLKNEGTYEGELKLEAGIPPDTWDSFIISGEYSSNTYHSITKCCEGNEYYDAVQITLDPGESEIVTFNLIAPTIHSVDTCDDDLKSAWDSSHTLIVGLYEQCGQGYVNYKAKDIKVRDRYCNRNSDCWDNENCDFSKDIPGVCVVTECNDECSSEGAYFCDGSELKECIEESGCLRGKHTAYCSGDYECREGQSSCYYKPPETQVKVDYAVGDTLVIKQPGDILKLRLKYSRTETINLEYDHDAFTSTDCSDSFSITSDKECSFIVNEKTGNYQIGIENAPKKRIKIIKDPKIIIVTDRQKLIERFGDDDEVDSLLAEAYRTAEDKNGIVYDLNEYLDNNLWNTMGDYDGGKYVVR